MHNAEGSLMWVQYYVFSLFCPTCHSLVHYRKRRSKGRDEYDGTKSMFYNNSCMTQALVEPL